MLEITITGAELDAFRRAMILVYSARVDALSHELGRALGPDLDVDGIRARRHDVDAAAAVVEHIGWEQPQAHAAARVCAERSLLQAALRAMITDAAEELSAAIESRDWSVVAQRRMRGALERIGGLLDRLAGVADP